MFETWALKSDVEPKDITSCPTYSLASEYFGEIYEKLKGSGFQLSQNTSYCCRLFGSSAPQKKKSFDQLKLSDLLFDRAAMASPLRLSTSSVRLAERSAGQFKEIDYTDYLPQIIKYIESNRALQLKEEDRRKCIDQLHTLQLFTQILFNECLARVYLQKLKAHFKDNEKLKAMVDCLDKFSFSQTDVYRRQVLLNRKAFSDAFDELKKKVQAFENEYQRKQCMAYLDTVKASFYQRNDLHYTYALPSSRISACSDRLELWGGRIGLGATVGAIIFSVIALTSPFFPFVMPALLVSWLAAISITCTAIVILTSFPRALKNLGMICYNLYHFAVAPTYEEVTSVSLAALAILAAGLGGVIGGLLPSALFADISGGFLTISNLIKVGVGAQKEKEIKRRQKTREHISESASNLVGKLQQDDEGLNHGEGGQEETVYISPSASS